MDIDKPTYPPKTPGRKYAKINNNGSTFQKSKQLPTLRDSKKGLSASQAIQISDSEGDDEVSGEEALDELYEGLIDIIDEIINIKMASYNGAHFKK